MNVVQFLNVRAETAADAAAAALSHTPGYVVMHVRHLHGPQVPHLGGLHVDADPDGQECSAWRVTLQKGTTV